MCDGAHKCSWCVFVRVGVYSVEWGKEKNRPEEYEKSFMQTSKTTTPSLEPRYHD